MRVERGAQQRLNVGEPGRELEAAPAPQLRDAVQARPQRPGHDLGEGRKDRVLELGNDQSDHAGAARAQLGRALIADDVERRQDSGACRLRDPRPVIENAADRGLTDPGLLGYVS